VKVRIARCTTCGRSGETIRCSRCGNPTCDTCASPCECGDSILCSACEQAYEGKCPQCPDQLTKIKSEAVTDLPFADVITEADDDEIPF
jgi:hypothetical protein